MGQANDSNEQQGSQNQSNWVAVTKTAKCNRCGRDGLAWQKGKSGKWYLCATRRNNHGQLEADRRAFHKCQPSFENDHGMEVSDADIPF